MKKSVQLNVEKLKTLTRELRQGVAGGIVQGTSISSSTVPQQSPPSTVWP